MTGGDMKRIHLDVGEQHQLVLFRDDRGRDRRHNGAPRGDFTRRGACGL